MRKLIIPVVAAVLALTGCGTPHYGAGEVSGKSMEPAEYMTLRECTRIFSKAYCATPRLKEGEEYEITFVDRDSKQEVEVEVNFFIYQNCRIGQFFDGERCTTLLTPSPAVS